MEANEYMLEAFKEKESKDKNDDDHTNPLSGGGEGGAKAGPEQAPENKGTLMLDATCAPSNIRYPQDFALLNEAREKLETIIIRFCKSYGFLRPRMYRRQAWNSEQMKIMRKKHIDGSLKIHYVLDVSA